MLMYLLRVPSSLRGISTTPKISHSLKRICWNCTRPTSTEVHKRLARVNLLAIWLGKGSSYKGIILRRWNKSTSHSSSISRLMFPSSQLCMIILRMARSWPRESRWHCMASRSSRWTIEKNWSTNWHRSSCPSTTIAYSSMKRHERSKSSSSLTTPKRSEIHFLIIYARSTSTTSKLFGSVRASPNREIRWGQMIRNGKVRAPGGDSMNPKATMAFSFIKSLNFWKRKNTQIERWPTSILSFSWRSHVQLSNLAQMWISVKWLRRNRREKEAKKRKWARSLTQQSMLMLMVDLRSSLQLRIDRDRSFQRHHPVSDPKPAQVEVHQALCDRHSTWPPTLKAKSRPHPFKDKVARGEETTMAW